MSANRKVSVNHLVDIWISYYYFKYVLLSIGYDGAYAYNNYLLYNCNSQDAQKNYTRTAKELNRIRSEYGELEGSMTKMRLNLQSTSNNSNKDRKRIQELSEEVRWDGAPLVNFTIIYRM